MRKVSLFPRSESISISMFLIIRRLSVFNPFYSLQVNAYTLSVGVGGLAHCVLRGCFLNRSSTVLKVLVLQLPLLQAVS